MDIIKYKSTLKASGDDYKKIVFWNRFIRNPIELILSWLPALASVLLISLGYFNSYLAVIYACCFAYPLYIFLFQFKSSVNYHLKHRDPAEDAPCTITLMNNGILADIPQHDVSNMYNWEDFTVIYDKFGYYMCFNGSKMLVMLKQSDMDDKQRKSVPEYIKSHVDMNKCRILFK